MDLVELKNIDLEKIYRWTLEKIESIVDFHVKIDLALYTEFFWPLQITVNLAQRQSVDLISQRSRVRIPDEARNFFPIFTFLLYFLVYSIAFVLK